MRRQNEPHVSGPDLTATSRFSLARLVRFSAVALSGLGLSACSLGILAPVGPVGEANKEILLGSVAIMLAIVVPTIIATFLFAWWFRASNTRARYLPNWEYSGQIEMVVWSIPALVILLLGGVAWIGSHKLDPAKPLPTANASVEPLDIQVVSLDWKWLFLYPKLGIATLNKMVVPAGVPLRLSLTSASVMNVFFVPQFGSMIYAMNGMSTRLNLQADQTGVFRGMAAHYSGDGFSGMHFNVHVLDQAAFSEWSKSGGGATGTLDEQRYRELLRQSINDPPTTYKLADPNLYQAIVTQKLPPGEGPQIGRPTPQVSPRSGVQNVR